MLRIFFALTFVVLLSAVDVFAQAVPGAAKPRSTANGQVELELSDGSQRIIGIHRHDGSTPDMEHVYFHEPLFAFVLNPEPEEGFPAFAYPPKVVDFNQSVRTLYFKVEVSNPEFRAFTKYQVSLQDGENLAQFKVDSDAVDVRRWPMRTASIVCYKQGQYSDNGILGISRTENLSGLGDEFVFAMEFLPSKYRDFLLYAQENAVEFVFRYSYEGTISGGASREIIGVKSLALKAVDSLTSEQRTGNAPIFQATRNELEQELKFDLLTVVRAQDKSVIDVLGDPITPLFRDLMETRTVTIDNLGKSSQDSVQQLSQYLRPLLETLSKGEKNFELVTETEEHQSGKEKSFGVGISYSGIGASGGRKMSKMDRDALEKTTGVEFTFDENRQLYIPHAIQVHFLAKGWEKTEFTSKDLAIVALGADGDKTSSPVPSTMSSQQLQAAISKYTDEVRESELSQTTIGMVTYYSGTNIDDLPGEWMVAAGQSLKVRDYSQLYQVIGTQYGDGGNDGDFNLPNGQGLFVRAMQVNGTGKGERIPASDTIVDGSLVGSTQEDSTSLPKAGFKTSLGDPRHHMHERLIVNLDIQGNRIEEDKNDNPNGVYKGHGKENLNENPTSSYSGEHTHIVEGGDPETRPVNIALYLVIRVK